jgi:anti-anti-sigma factor
MKTRAKRIEVSIVSALEYLDLIQGITDSITGFMGFDDDAAHWIAMSVRESVTNAIQHGNRMDQYKKVDIHYELDSNQLQIKVRDQGQGFDINGLPNPLDPENLLKPSGRGVFYIRSFMDEVTFRSLPQGGLEVHMLKKNESFQDQGENDMQIHSRTVGEIHVLDCSGKITLGEGTMAVRNAVKEVLSSGGKKIILNLGDVNYIDSSGIGELVSSYTSVTNQGGQLKLLHLTKKIHELLAITKLLTVFPVFDDEKAALGSF